MKNQQSWILQVFYGIALCLSLVTPAFSLEFNFTYTGGTQADQDAFAEAGAFWSSKFNDDVTLNMSVGTAALGSGTLAQASSTKTTVTYGDFMTALSSDSTTNTDISAVSSLSGGSSFDMLINRTANNPNGSGSATAYLDDGDANNTTIRLNSANAKALGFAIGGTDATITFSNAFTWDYDSSDGVNSGAYDFVGIAIHEIGHALGFVSGVDILDGNSPPVNGPFSGSSHDMHDELERQTQRIKAKSAMALN